MDMIKLILRLVVMAAAEFRVCCCDGLKADHALAFA